MLKEKGSLKETPTIKLLLTLFEQGLTGILSIKRESIRKILYFKQGNLIWAISNSRNDELDNILVTQNLVAPKNIERVKQMAESPEALGKLLVEKGLITIEELIKISREQLKGIVYSVLKWPEGQFKFVSEEPPELLMHLELNITDFVRNFILTGADIGFIRQQVGSVESQFVKNPDSKKIKRYNFSDQQLRLLDYFDGATSLEAILAKYPQENGESIMKMVYYFLMADILLNEKLEFSDSPALREKEPAKDLEVESTEYKNEGAAEAVPSREEPESYGIAREIEVQNTPEREDILESVLDAAVGGEEEQGVYELDSGRMDGEAGAGAIEQAGSGETYDPGGLIETGRAEAVELPPGMGQHPGVESTAAGQAAGAGGSDYVVGSNESMEQAEAEKLPTQPAAPPFKAADSDPGGEPLSSVIPPGIESVGASASGLDEFELPGEQAVEDPLIDEGPQLAPDKKELSPDLEPLKMDEDFIRDREPAAFRKNVVTEKKKSKLIYLILLSIAVILIISGAIFLYLDSPDGEVDEDLIPPVNVTEKQPVPKKDVKRTGIPMQKQGTPGQQTAKPGDKTAQTGKDQGTKAVSPVQPPGKIYERFGIKSAELKKKLSEKKTAAYFVIKLGDPQAQKYFKQAKFIEAGNTWKKELQKAGMKFAILLEMDCMKESVINAFLRIVEKDNFYLLNRKLGKRNCFLVMWGKFYTKKEASDALKTLPIYFRNQKHPPKVVSLSRYM